MDNNDKELIKINLKTKIRKIISIYLTFFTPFIFLSLMILILNYTTNIWYYLKPKPIIFTIFLLELIHILLTSITRK